MSLYCEICGRWYDTTVHICEKSSIEYVPDLSTDSVFDKGKVISLLKQAIKILQQEEI